MKGFRLSLCEAASSTATQVLGLRCLPCNGVPITLISVAKLFQFAILLRLKKLGVKDTASLFTTNLSRQPHLNIKIILLNISSKNWSRLII